ncbi:WGR and DUF4132 domain-containing protein [Streptomyces sp. IBSNAI002]|uniref:WGR and DUF4132 domain-containing protein n=1 Tax=Streptomyces sp. IBSNAI002 TaxID=3457500 RepID=UPI003FD4BE0A
MRRWEYVDGGSAKFWEAAAEGTSVTVRFGRTGTVGQTRVKEFGSAADAQSHLVKAMAEKERKGYAEVAQAGAAALPAVPAAVGPAVAEVPAAPAVPADEDTFTLPEEWKRNLYPRRGGVPCDVPAVEADALRALRESLERSAETVERVLSSPQSDPALVEAARAHRSGSPSPLGAAVLAELQTGGSPAPSVVDAWAAEFGLPFAARAAAEMQEIHAEWASPSPGDRSRKEAVVMTADPDVHHRGTWGRMAARHPLARIRALLSVADEETYRAAVAGLATARRTPRQQITACFIAPAEQEWVEECCADPALRAHPDRAVREMLLCSLGSPGQAALFDDRGDLGWTVRNAAVVPTVAEGIGVAMAPLAAGELNRHYIDTDDTKAIAAALVELPSDEAFGFLVERLDDKYVRIAVAAAARRYPVRALRLLAKAAGGAGPTASMAGQLLVTHVAAHRELVLGLLADLPEELAARVGPLARQEGRVAEVPEETLPPLLTSPPWTRKRTVATPRTVGGLAAPEEPRTRWRTGEREAWAATESWVTTWEPYHPMETYVEHLRQGMRRRQWDALAVFVKGPEEQVRPLLAGWQGTEYTYEGLSSFKPLVARHELAALPVAVSMATRNPKVMAPLLLPFLDAGVARLMAGWLVRLKAAGETARSWFVRHGAGAARLLVPDALGAPGAERTAAEQALSVIVAAHGADAVRRVAAEYGPEAAEALEPLLTADPLAAALPARMPKVAGWAAPQALPQILLRSGGALPAVATSYVLTMLAVSTPSAEFPGLAQVRDLCTPQSLAAFGWALFTEWQLAGMPPKEAWALHALGRFGDDGTVRALTPVIRAWPGEGAHHRAVDGLEVLAAIGTDVALLHLHGIAQRVKFKALKLRAREKIAEVAAGLGLTGEQLSDRLVPDLGLDADGSTVIDYGTRRFTVGFDEQLRPYVLGEDGRRLKDLPKPGTRDDAELAVAERKRFTALKKDVRTIASDQVRRLEAAMVDGRSWTAAEFRRLFVEHPLVWHLVRRLVWRAEQEGGVTAFRVAEDRTYADAEDETVTFADDAGITLAHPLDLDGALAGWSELFADYEILQPFPQLGRPVLAVTEEEAADSRLTRFEGITVPVGRLLALQKRGWERGEPQDAGVERWFSRRLGPERYLVIGLDEGIAVGMIGEFPDQKLETVWLDTRPCDYWRSRTYPLKFGDLSPVLVSEVLADLTELTS